LRRPAVPAALAVTLVYAVNGETTTIATRVPPAVAEALSAMAAREDRTISAELRRAVRDYITRNDDEPAHTGSIANGTALREPTRERV
jgi:predicted transcriptional regulator